MCFKSCGKLALTNLIFILQDNALKNVTLDDVVVQAKK